MIDIGDLDFHIGIVVALYPGVGRMAGVAVLVALLSIAFSGSAALESLI
jgi:hypothetical protein